MRVVSHKTLVEFYLTNNQSKTALEVWYRKISNLEISNFSELRRYYPSADYVGNDRVVFNIKGNDYRLICIVKYSSQKVYVRFIGTHSAYSQINGSKI